MQQSTDADPCASVYDSKRVWRYRRLITSINSQSVRCNVAATPSSHVGGDCHDDAILVRTDQCRPSTFDSP